MSSKRRELLMCVLHRAGVPLTSGQVEDAAIGLATAEEWPELELKALTRKSVSGLLVNLEKSDRLMVDGEVSEDGRSGMVPTYRPYASYDPSYPVPDCPQSKRIPKESDYESHSKSQLITLLDMHDGLAEVHARFMTDLERWRVRARRTLADAGMGRD